MAGRDISSLQRAWLTRQLDEWQSQEIVSTDQASQILKLYVSDSELAERRSSVALRTLMGLAGFLVGLGVLLLVGYNWQAMPTGLKLLIVFAALIGTHVVAYVLRFKQQKMLLSESMYLIACLLYGAGIFLVAQIFHLNAHYPDGVWWWALGVLPFAICLNSIALHVLLVSLLAIWCGMELIGFGDIGWWFFGRWRFLPNGAYTLPLLALPGFVWTYRRNSALLVGLYAGLVAWWVILQPFGWGIDEQSIYLVGLVGGLMLVIAECHTAGSAFAVAYRLPGVFLSGFVLLLLSFYELSEEIVRANFQIGGLLFAMLTAGVAFAIFNVASVLQPERSEELASLVEQLRQFAQRQWLPVGIVALMLVLMCWHAAGGGPLLPTVLANVALVSLSIWLMRTGLVEDRGQPFTVGVVCFLLWAVVRYVDLFGDAGGMLGASMMFFLCGAALFGVALYWRRRGELQHG